MKRSSLSIGELSRRTGVPVKTLRFWSDEGLISPQSRSEAGYRLYAKETTVRVDLLRTLRDAGLGHDAIKKVLRRDLSLADALRLHLAAVEAHASSLQRVAAAIRAALRGPEPNESDVRRLCAVTRLTNEERKAVIEKFYERVSEGIPIDAEWRKRMIEASTPSLPDNPTPEQLDAWVELAELVADPAFVESLRTNAREVWDNKVDMAKLRAANDEAARAAASLRARGVGPESNEARDLVLGFVAGIAAASGKANDDKLRHGVRDRFARQDARATRYWELVSMMTGRPHPQSGTPEDWKLVAEAVKLHLA